MGKVDGAIIGAIAGLIIVSARVFYAVNYYRPSTGFLAGLGDPDRLFSESLFFWLAFGPFFGVVIGVLVGTILDYFDIAGWRIINAIYGAICGFAITVGFCLLMFLLLTLLIPFRSSERDTLIWQIGFGAFYIGIGLLGLFIPGVIIGALVGLLLNRVR